MSHLIKIYAVCEIIYFCQLRVDPILKAVRKLQVTKLFTV